MMVSFRKNDEGLLEVYEVVTLESEIGFYLERENLVWKARLIFRSRRHRRLNPVNWKI